MKVPVKLYFQHYSTWVDVVMIPTMSRNIFEVNQKNGKILFFE